MLRVDAENNELKVGDPFNPYGEPTPMRVVGIYTPTNDPADDAFWGGTGRLQSTPGFSQPFPPKLVPAHPLPGSPRRRASSCATPVGTSRSTSDWDAAGHDRRRPRPGRRTGEGHR